MVEDVREMLLRYRRQENITISELAERTGVSKSVLSRIESGETKRPGFTTCKKITRALQIPYASLVSSYLDVTERAEMLKFLLEEAVSLNNRSLVRKAAQKLLETPKMDTFLALDTLLQVAKEKEEAEIKLALYDVLIDYTRRRGIPYYLAKGLLERYEIERDHFTQFEETYRRGKELLHYIEYLHPFERISAYYRLGVHAYILDYYQECIDLCSKGIREDQTDSKQKASALIAIVNAYLRLNDLILAELYLKKYEKSEYADFRKNHLRALLYAKKGEYDEATSLYKKCLNDTSREGRISIVSDLLEVYLEIGRYDLIKELIELEDQFLPEDILTHPYRIKQAARYYKRKGLCQFAIGQVDEGFNSLLQSILYYRQLGDFQKVTECISLVIENHRLNKKNLSFEYMEKISSICHNDTSVVQGGEIQ
jgi:transcriptional regulator with XRE-family HTH domain